MVAYPEVRAALARLQTQQAQDRDALQLLVGAPLDAALLPSAQALDGTVALAPLPANLPSSVLLQRPDVLSAEHALQAANADIGAARAAFFPTLTLTANYGHSSTVLSTLFSRFQLSHGEVSSYMLMPPPSWQVKHLESFEA